MTIEPWKIAEDAADWQCDWISAKRFQLRYFRSLPMVDKLRAVEAMQKLVQAFAARRDKKLNRPGGREGL